MLTPEQAHQVVVEDEAGAAGGGAQRGGRAHGVLPVDQKVEQVGEDGGWGQGAGERIVFYVQAQQLRHARHHGRQLSQRVAADGEEDKVSQLAQRRRPLGRRHRGALSDGLVQEKDAQVGEGRHLGGAGAAQGCVCLLRVHCQAGQRAWLGAAELSRAHTGARGLGPPPSLTAANHQQCSSSRAGGSAAYLRGEAPQHVFSQVQSLQPGELRQRAQAGRLQGTVGIETQAAVEGGEGRA